MGALDLGFCLGLDVGIDRRRDFVGFINGCGFRLLFGPRAVYLQRRQFRTVHAFEDSFQLMLQPLVRPDFGGALQQQVSRLVKTLLGLFQVPGFESFLTLLIFPLNLHNQIGDHISAGLRGRLGIRDRGTRYGLGKGSQDRSYGWRVSLRRRDFRLPWRGGVAGRCGQSQSRHQQSQQVELLNSHFYL